MDRKADCFAISTIAELTVSHPIDEMARDLRPDVFVKWVSYHLNALSAFA